MAATMSGGGMPGGGVMGQQTQVVPYIDGIVAWSKLTANLGPERVEEPAEAAAQGREEEDLRRDGHQWQRV